MFLVREVVGHSRCYGSGGLFTFPATGNTGETPVVAHYTVWNPDGKLAYQHVGSVVDTAGMSQSPW
jgi:hypothetical protein